MKKERKEYTNLFGVRNSFVATISLAKHTWMMEPQQAIDWYIDHVKKQGRALTAQTANQYRFELDDVFYNWILKNAIHKKNAKSAKPSYPDDEIAAAEFLRERGYVVRKRKSQVKYS